ncbi:hypothetical protein E2986_12252 [Frieseomelitta varia]|uniref:Uncharacterized protein n=1 Tax=Frieseomelitta varia TaxID=561572 RepID=A0A833S317_9HYME|nr:hypothetical protein E2986_12252 [Frieseomelitta varia]
MLYRRVRKESDGLLYTVLVTRYGPQNQLPAQVNSFHFTMNVTRYLKDLEMLCPFVILRAMRSPSLCELCELLSVRTYLRSTFILSTNKEYFLRLEKYLRYLTLSRGAEQLSYPTLEFQKLPVTDLTVYLGISSGSSRDPENPRLFCSFLRTLFAVKAKERSLEWIPTPKLPKRSFREWEYQKSKSSKEKPLENSVKPKHHYRNRTEAVLAFK